MSEPDIQSEVTESESTQDMNQVDQAEANEDAILDRLLSDEEETSVSPEPKATQVESTKTAVATENPEREQAVAILRRDGVPQSIIDGATDEVLNDWVAKASKRQKDVDGFRSKIKELEKKVAASSKTADLSDDEDLIVEDDDTVEPSESDEASEESVNDERSDDGEPEGKKKPTMKSMADELAELRKAQQDFQQQSLLYKVEVAEAAIRALYGDRSPDRQAVIAEMDRLGAAKPGSYQSYVQLAQEAYSNLVGPLNQSNARKASQPSVPTKKTRVEPTKSPADQEDEILDALMDGRPLSGGTRNRRK